MDTMAHLRRSHKVAAALFDRRMCRNRILMWSSHRSIAERVRLES
jgi:hypothetical protein